MADVVGTLRVELDEETRRLMREISRRLERLIIEVADLRGRVEFLEMGG